MANAGGVTVSYFEWVQDLQELWWDEDDVNRRLEKIMVKAFNDVYATAERYSADLRTGAYILAIDRVADATKTRGICPCPVCQRPCEAILLGEGGTLRPLPFWDRTEGKGVYREMVARMVLAQRGRRRHHRPM